MKAIYTKLKCERHHDRDDALYSCVCVPKFTDLTVRLYEYSTSTWYSTVLCTSLRMGGRTARKK